MVPPPPPPPPPVGAFTTMVALALLVRGRLVLVTEAVSWTTYVPSVVNVIWLTGEEPLLNVAGAGPLIWLQELTSVVPGGKAVSVAEPFRVVEGVAMLWFGPALTTGRSR